MGGEVTTNHVYRSSAGCWPSMIHRISLAPPVLLFPVPSMTDDHSAHGVRHRCHYWIQALCRVPNAPGKGYFALGKAFAGCSTWQRASGKKLVGKDFFAGCFLSGTRQRLCRVQTRHPAKKSGRYGAGSVIPCFAGCHVRGTRQRFF